MSRITIRSFGPRRVWALPGAAVLVDLEMRAPQAVRAQVTIDLLEVDEVVRSVRRRVSLGPDPVRLTVRLRLPSPSRRGYGLAATVSDGTTRVTASSAVEALDGWWQSPRHAAVTDYGAERRAGAATRDLAGWHVTVLQHYDWMWRHYRYRPPHRAHSFVDTLGRTVSHDAVRASIRAGHAFGAASLAYGAVYGAELEHVERHPGDRVFDRHGDPLSLGGTFFITDLRPGSAWRRRLLDEYAAAIRGFGFDGIHMDTYGPPHEAVAADGERIDFASVYPGLIAEAADRVAGARPGARVVFNCVDGFPLRAVASAPVAGLYLELWPPDRAFADVVRWVEDARAVAEGRQVVIAAYAATLRDRPRGPGRAAAFEVVLLLGAVIAAAGAYHHTLAEGDRLIVEGYYPAAARLTLDEARPLRALARFGARYVHLLSDPGMAEVDVDGLRVTDAAGRSIRLSSRPEPGRVWAMARRAPDGRTVLHLVDLTIQEDGHWDTPKHVSPRVSGWRLDWRPLRSPVAASPWSAGAAARTLRPAPGAGNAWLLPPFRRWLMVVDGEG